MDQRRRAGLLLGVIYLGFISLGLPDGSFGAAWPKVYPELGLPVGLAGVIMTVGTLLTATSGFSSGRIIARWRTGPVVLASGMLTASGLLLIGRAQSLAPGEILMIENLRFDPGEEKCDPAFATNLSELGDAYVDDAFGAAHRAHASIVGPPRVLPSAAGRLLASEVTALSRLLDEPKHPFVAVLGGAKVSDKLEHFIAYGLLAGMLHLSLWPKRWPIAKLAIVVLMTCMGYGGFDELTQPFFRRTCDIRDWTADVIGASIAITFMTAASVFIPKRFTGD